MIHSREFWQSIKVTLFYASLSVPLYLVLGLSLAILLNQRVRGMYVFRTILFLPTVLSGVAVAVLWVSLLNPDLGVVNQVLRWIGIDDPPRWLLSPTWAVPAIVLMGLWGIGGERDHLPRRPAEHPARRSTRPRRSTGRAPGRRSATSRSRSSRRRSCSRSSSA